MLKNNIEKIFIIIMFCVIFFPIKVNALELKYDYTKEYLEWLELSDEEKENSPLPQMTAVKLEDSKDLGWNDEFVKMNNLKPVGSTELGTRFNLADEIEIKIKNQGLTNECWAFSALSSLETSLLHKYEIDIDFSERHMDYATSGSFTDVDESDLLYIRNVKNGALPETALAYLTNGQGAVLEEEMPFENNYEPITIDEIDIKPSYYVTDYKQFPSIYKTYNEDGSINYFDAYGTQYSMDDVNSIRTEIKNYISKHGAITAVTASSYIDGYNNTESPYESTAYCCKDVSALRDHSITIVGWDDNYSKENFNSNNMPTSDGAYIILQSYGEEFFDNGYIYISYEDCLIETILYGISDAEEYDYDNLYQHNYYGSTGTLYLSGYSTGFQATIFERDSSKNETLNKIAFNLPEKETIMFFVNPNGDDLSKDSLIEASEVMYDMDAGYYTIDITPLELTSDKFAIVMAQVSESGDFYFNVEYKADKIFYANVTAESGRNKISTDGENWFNLEDLSDDELIKTADLCIKAFTVENEVEPDEPNEPEQPDEPLVEPSEINSEKYVIDSKYIKNVDAYTTSDEFFENLDIKSSKIELYSDELEQNTEGIIYLKTGMKLLLDDKEYTIIVKGDITSDGKISLLDLSKLIAHYAEIKDCEMNELEQLAGDMNIDGKISLIDLSKLLVIYSNM